jgi:hypothetical protein
VTYARNLLAEKEDLSNLTIDNISKKTFRGVMDYIYGDCIRRLDSLLHEDLVHIFQAGKLLQLPELCRKVEFYLTERVDKISVSAIFLSIQELDMPILRKVCMSYMAGNDLYF